MKGKKMKSYKTITACLLCAAMTATMPSYAWASEADNTVFSDGQTELTDGNSTMDTEDVEIADDAVSDNENTGNLTDSSEVFNADAENDETKDNPSEVFSILPDKLEYGHVDKFYLVQLKSDSEMPVKWKLCGENKLPDGFTFSEDGVLSGMPKRMGYYSFGVQADNGELIVYKKISFQIRSREREEVPYRLELLDNYDQAKLDSNSFDKGVKKPERGYDRDNRT